MSAAKAPKKPKAVKAGTRPAGPIGVNLLPEEIKQAERAASQRRLLVLLTILVVVAVAAASVGAWFSAQSAANHLAEAEATAARILAEQADHLEGQAVADKTLATEDAQRLVAGTEIDWSLLLVAIIGATPASVSITSFELDSSTPYSLTTQAPGPLDPAALGTITLAAIAPSIPDVDAWVKKLEKLDGIAGTRVLRIEDASTVSVTLFVSDEILRARFDPNVEGYKEPKPTPTPTETPTPTAEPVEPTPTPTPTEEG